MIKKILIYAVLIFSCLLTAGCVSIPFFEKNESEIIVSCGSTFYNGSYNIYLNGESRKTVKSNGGTVVYRVPNDQHVIMVSWLDNYGVPTDMASIKVNTDFNRVFLFVAKTGVHEDMEITLVDTVYIQP